MADCIPFNVFSEYIRGIDQAVEIDKSKDKPIRFNVWKTTPADLKKIFAGNNIDHLPQDGKDTSDQVKSKINNALERVMKHPSKAAGFKKDIIDSDNNIELSIALHEVMESIKGEADKARNNGIEIEAITNDGVLPALPMARIAASIGRKIAYQKGIRFKKRKNTEDNVAAIESIYYNLGKRAVEELVEKGYLKLHDNVPTIRDYISKADLTKPFPVVGKPTSDTDGNHVLSVSLDEKKMNIVEGKPEADHFLKRSEADLSNVELGAIVDMLKVARQVTQPSTVVLPDTSKTARKLSDNDTGAQELPAQIESARQKLYDNPLYINSPVKDLLELLHKEAASSNQSASEIIRDIFSNNPILAQSLFGLKKSDDFSIDKKESVAGQNLSKTTPLDDVVEYFMELLEGGGALHLPLKDGRNARLYYYNSVLNPHMSKQMRYMLTAGEQTLDHGSDDFDYLVHAIGESLDSNLSFNELTTNTDGKLDKALELFAEYEAATDLKVKLAKIAHIAVKFKGVDYVSLITGLRAVNDIRNPKNGKVTTEFMVSADATASGGTLTFLQALGSEPEIVTFLQRIGLLKDENGNVVKETDPTGRDFDLYRLMTEAVDNFINDVQDTNSLPVDPGSDSQKMRTLLGNTLDMLFNEGKDAREFSKDPTMTFVYGQGKKSATQTIARSLADRIIDNLDSLQTRQYLANLFNDPSYRDREGQSLRNEKDLYKLVVEKLGEEKVGLAATLFDLMDSSIKDKYLKQHTKTAKKVYSLMEKVNTDKSFKILPAGAVMQGDIEPTVENLDKYGMPISKIFEVEGTGLDGDTILTRKEKPTKTVMDVSTIHGADSALLYNSVDNSIGSDGMVVIHDDVRGTVKDVRATEADYRNQALKLAKEYDIHQQVLNAIAAYDPELAQSKEFLDLKETIDAKIAERNKILDTQFNEDTDAFIGDGDKYKRFADKKNGTAPLVTGTATKESRADTVKKAQQVISSVSGRSPIVRKLLTLSPNFIRGKTNSYEIASDTISISQATLDNATPEQQAQTIEHEAIHAVTATYISKVTSGEIKDTEQQTTLKFLRHAVQRLRDAEAFGKTEGVSDTAKQRIAYITSQTADLNALAEFLAVMGAENDTANEIYQVLSGTVPEKTLRSRIEAMIEGVKKYILNLTKADFENDIDADKLQIAIMNTIVSGISHRESVVSEGAKYNSDIQGKLGYEAEVSSSVEPEVSMRYLNHAFQTMINNPLERRGKSILVNLHNWMDDYPVYRDVANKARGVYKDSTALQQLVHTITGEGINKSQKAKILSQFAKVGEQQAETRNTIIDNLNRALVGVSDKQQAQITRFVMDMPLHDYFLLSDQHRTAQSIDQEVTRLKALLQKKPSILRDVEALVDWNIHGKEGGSSYNLDHKYQMGTDKSGAAEFSEEVRRYLALRSIQEIGAKDFEQFLDNKELAGLVKEASVANRIALTSIHGLSELPDSMVKSYTQEPVDVRAVTVEELQRYELGEDTGWKVLRPASAKELGIVYREVVDSTSQLGAYTDINLLSDDISLPESKRNFKGVVKTRSGAKLRLTKQDKIDLGQSPGFVDALAHSVSHNMAIQDSEVIRGELLKQDTRLIVEGKDDSDLVKILDSNNVDNPWFVKLDKDVTLADLNKKVRDKYTVARRASNVGNFNQEVTLVRKDISHWLVGGNAPSFFQNPKMRWATRIVKDLVAGSKIGMIVLNPVKIANDNLSNVAYLGVVGVDPVFIAKNYRDITKEYTEYADLKGELLRLKVRLVANPESQKLKKKAKSLQDRLEANPLNDLDDKGFVNSLGSSLIGKNSHTLTGVQADAEKALTYLLKREDGKNNLVAHFIFQLQDLGFHGEDFLTYLGGIAGNAETTKGVETKLDLVAERLKTIRSEKDIVNYVAQYTTSPSSEAVRLGSAATDLSDVLAKETLYRHLRQNENMSHEDAKIKVLDSFPDYKENMPMAVKQMSDLGLLLFPSFWMRIQKSIYRMVKEKPVGLATEILIQDALNSDINTIVGSNIVEKYNSFGGVFHNPADIIGMNSLVPTHMF